MNGTRDRTRTGTVFPPRDFLTSYSFRCHISSKKQSEKNTNENVFGVWTISLPLNPPLHQRRCSQFSQYRDWVRGDLVRQEPYGLYTFLAHDMHKGKISCFHPPNPHHNRLSLARRCHFKGFTEFDSIHLKISP